MLKTKCTIECCSLGNPDYLACYTCLTPLVLNQVCWFINTGNDTLYVPKKEGTFKQNYDVCYAVCCSEGCVELAFIAIL